MPRSRLARLACLSAFVVTLPLAAEEVAVKPHPLDPRQQDRHSVLAGYKSLHELVTTTPPKTWTELKQVAEFFQNRDIDGKKVYGAAIFTERGSEGITMGATAADHAK